MYRLPSPAAPWATGRCISSVASDDKFVGVCSCGGEVRGVNQFGQLFTFCTKCTPVVKVTLKPLLEATVPYPPLSYAARSMLQNATEKMVDKFGAAEAKHGWSDYWARTSEKEWRKGLKDHLHKGDLRDVMIYCAIGLARGWRS